MQTEHETHFAFFTAAVTLSHALLMDVDTVFVVARADSCRAFATSAPFVAAAVACKSIKAFSRMYVEGISADCAVQSSKCYNHVSTTTAPGRT